jgi:hypothetical protein
VCAITETDIERATDGLGRVRVVRLAAGAVYSPGPFGEFVFFYVLSGSLRTNESKQTLRADEHIVFSRNVDMLTLRASEDTEFLEVRLREI